MRTGPAGFWRWRLRDPTQWIFEEFGITLDKTTAGRTLRAMEYRKPSDRPHHHAQNELPLDD